ncbi:hypothetical protein D1872_229870 [compost metagenome]
MLSFTQALYRNEPDIKATGLMEEMNEKVCALCNDVFAAVHSSLARHGEAGSRELGGRDGPGRLFHEARGRAISQRGEERTSSIPNYYL